MRYHHQTGLRSRRHWSLRRRIVAAAIIAAPLYVGANFLAPYLPALPSAQSEIISEVKTDVPEKSIARLFAPSLGAKFEVEDAQTKIYFLEKPADVTDQDVSIGGAVYEPGITPWQTRANSPFSTIDKIKPGDQVYLDYDGERYVYEIKESDQAGIDAPQLRILGCGDSCDDVRAKVVAYLLGKVTWTDGQPKIQPLGD